MTEFQMIYRDPETGKIWQKTGDREPVEIDEFFARMMHLDVDSIPVLEHKEPVKVFCPNCGNPVGKAPYCSMCGAKLNDQEE